MENTADKEATQHNNTKMNPEIKKLWVNALRSGEYKQWRGKLRCNSNFCCLGVLCDIHAKAFRNNWFEDTYLNKVSSVPFNVVQWSELNTPKIPPHIGEKLVFMNDNEKKSFAEIADFIEQNL